LVAAAAANHLVVLLVLTVALVVAGRVMAQAQELRGKAIMAVMEHQAYMVEAAVQVLLEVVSLVRLQALAATVLRLPLQERP
jgi:hypothetical protein